MARPLPGIVCAEGHKFCAQCNTVLPHSNFAIRKRSSDGLYVWCKPCSSTYSSAWYEKNKEKVKAQSSAWTKDHPERMQEVRRKNRYKMSREDFADLMISQEGRCAICGVLFVAGVHMHIDHDHDCCGKGAGCSLCVRGALCGHCNRGLGGFRDDPFLMHIAADYIICHKERYAATEED